MKKILIKPTDKMVKELNRCLDLQMQNKPCFFADFKSSLGGLHRRGFVNTQMRLVNNKNLMTVYITNEGELFLKNLSGVKAKASSR